MKVRKEKSGLHFFNRDTGMHILFDEKRFEESEICQSPRTFSIALTNTCDLKCYFCYAPKSRHSLDFEYLKNVISEADKLGVLEITFGGGEPLLYPNLVDIIVWSYEQTKLSINFTTHGHHLNSEFSSRIEGKVSKIRISIDGLEPRYSAIRNRPLHSLEKLIKENIKGKIRFGINTVFTSDCIDELPNIIDYARHLGAEDILLIPEHDKGKLNFTHKEFKRLSQVIKYKQKSFQIYFTTNIENDINISTLQTHSEDEFLFAHLSADKTLKINSFSKDGISLKNPRDLSIQFNNLKN